MGYKTVNKSNLPMIDYRELVPLQGNLKDLTKANYQKLLKSIEKEGFFVPAFVWFNDGVPYILDAHQRHRVLTNENIEFENSGFEIPYIEIEAIILPTRLKTGGGVLHISCRFRRLQLQSIGQGGRLDA